MKPVTDCNKTYRLIGVDAGGTSRTVVMIMNNQISEDTYRRLKREVDNAKTEAERAKGALSQLITQLKTEFKCENLKEAKTLLEELEAKRDKAQKRFEAMLADYEENWKEKE